MSHAVPWFPLVGALIGACQGLVWLAAFEATSNGLLASALSIAAAALIAGAFHHDGLADMADAFGGGWTVEQRFEILKDSRLGTYGTSALVLAFATEGAALAAFEPYVGFRTLIGAHVLGRGVAVAAMYVSPVAGDGLGASYMSELRPVFGIVSVGFSIAIAVALLESAAPLAIALSIVAAACVVILAIRKIGGVTGDVLGAVFVMAYLATLVAASATFT